MEPIASPAPLPIIPPPPGVATGAGWSDFLGTTTAAFIALIPAPGHGAEQREDRRAGMVSGVCGNAADTGIMAAAQMATQVTMTLLPRPAGATPTQAAAQASEWVRAYTTTYNAWLAVLVRHRVPPPAVIATPAPPLTGPTLPSSMAGSAPTHAPEDTQDGKHRTPPADHKRPAKDRHAQASLLAHALTLWTQNVTATFSALPAFVPPRPAPGDADAAQHLRQLASCASRRLAAFASVENTRPHSS